MGVALLDVAGALDSTGADSIGALATSSSEPAADSIVCDATARVASRFRWVLADALPLPEERCGLLEDAGREASGSLEGEGGSGRGFGLTAGVCLAVISWRGLAVS